MKLTLTVAAAIAIAYILLVTIYALMQRSLIYYPTTLAIDQAQQRAESLGGVPWLSDAGDWLGWKAGAGGFDAIDQRPRALVFHGNAGMALNRDYYGNLLSGFRASGPWDVYIFEYPGYGPREGAPGEAAFTAAALAAVDDLLSRDRTPLLIIGESIGGGVASKLARERPHAVAALLLITPFDSLVNTARHHMPYLPTGLLLKDRYNNLEALRDFEKPLIVITAGKDTIVPPTLAAPLLRQHSGPLLHRVQTSAGHNTVHFRPESPPWPKIDEFLSRH